MKSTLECLACVAAQAVRVARAATDDPEVQRRILDETVKRMPGLDLEESPAVNSACAYELAAALSGNADPYGAARREQNELTLALEPELRERVRESADPLSTALHIAAAGNIIDLGIANHGEIDVRSAIDQALREQFAVEHLAEFRESLARADDVLFLLDNAGEIVFDKILIEELGKFAPVTAVVKGAPIINDVVMADAEQVGLTEVCDVIDNGGPFIGCPISLVPESFLERMRAADMIVAKGQGNYETVDDFPGDVFLILRAKCEIIARHMGGEYGQIGLISTRARRAAAGNGPAA
ncbi:MAG: DUF89 family protein [Candidatus Hydrogenedentes bacterium]|nr:DUF89 family protein [Candidatus Hydrogenedentota bacterium]